MPPLAQEWTPRDQSDAARRTAAVLRPATMEGARKLRRASLVFSITGIANPQWLADSGTFRAGRRRTYTRATDLMHARGRPKMVHGTFGGFQRFAPLVGSVFCRSVVATLPRLVLHLCR